MSAAASTTRLHPAAARRMAKKLPPRAHHDVTLSALGRAGDPAGRLAIFPEANFIEALYTDLRSEDWIDRLDAREPDAAARARLPLPMHRQTVVVLYEASCAVPGRPRVAREKIESMGIAIRREAQNSASPEGWIKAQGKAMGWQSVSGSEISEPDPARKMELFPGFNPAVLEQVATLRNQPTLPAEDIVNLQAVSGDICADLGRTILFAALPLASSESSPSSEDAFDYNALDADDVAKLEALYSWPWKQGDVERPDKGGEELDPAWFTPGTARDTELSEIETAVRQAVVECAMGEEGPGSAAMRSAFSSVTLVLREDGNGDPAETMPADEWMLAAAPIMLGQETNNRRILLPVEWPARSAGQQGALMAAVRASLTQQAGKFQPDTPKFDDPTDRYRIRPFVRVRHAPDCPIRLAWGEPSAPFGIRAWWDSDAPPHKISLPDLDNVKDLKPNIAFELPPQLAAMTAKDPNDIMEGKGGRPAKTGIGWLCSFSLPIITICAFITLNIFLQLFNFFFRWMLWIKVCIPIPKKEGG